MTRIERIDADLIDFYPLAGSAPAYGVRRALAALRLNKAKRRGLAALHTLARFRSRPSLFLRASLQLRAPPLSAILYIQLITCLKMMRGSRGFPSSFRFFIDLEQSEIEACAELQLARIGRGCESERRSR